MDTEGSSSREVAETSAVQEDIVTKSRSADRHKRVECKVCFRKMRSNNIKRHMKTHKKLLNQVEMHEEIERREKLKLGKEEEIRNTIRNMLTEELGRESTMLVEKESTLIKRSEFQFTSFITGYYFYHSRWTPYIGQELTTMCEMDNSYDKFSVSVYWNDMIVGHVPRQISPQFTALLKSDGCIQVKVIRHPFNTGNKGLRVPCIYTVSGKEKEVQNIKINVVNID